MPLEEWDDTVINSTGQHWDIYVGYVEAQGTAATVRSPITGVSTPVTSDGYYMLAEPTARDALAAIVLRETSAIGVRFHTVQRIILARSAPAEAKRCASIRCPPANANRLPEPTAPR